MQSYTDAGQQHVLSFLNELTNSEQQEFLRHLSSVCPKRVMKIYQQAQQGVPDSVFSPIPLEFTIHSSETTKIMYDAGIQAIKDGTVCLLCLAGGQGTRLGSSAPKGCFDIGLPSHKSLFQLQAERLKRIQELAKGKVHFYIMVSGPTRKETESFFTEHDYFGLQVHFFEQGTLPAIDASGKFLMESKTKLALSPDGNGGIYHALSQGVLEDMKKKGIKYVHAYCVDNCLVKVLDPAFIGYNILNKCEIGAKTVAKISPDEPVGVCCLRDGKFSVVEYSEIPRSLSEQRNESGLVYGDANIANHFYTVEFLESLKVDLKYHIAHKKVPHINEKGVLVTPSTPNAVKLELFIFDVFHLAKRYSVFKVNRQDEFSPLKNKTGPDSADSSRKDIMKLHLRFLQSAGAQVDSKLFNDIDNGAVCEISPLKSYFGENLDVKTKITLPFILN